MQDRQERHAPEDPKADAYQCTALLPNVRLPDLMDVLSQSGYSAPPSVWQRPGTVQPVQRDRSPSALFLSFSLRSFPPAMVRGTRCAFAVVLALVCAGARAQNVRVVVASLRAISSNAYGTSS